MPNVFAENAELLLDADSLVYVDKLLDNADLDNPKQDLFGDAYEVFVGSKVADGKLEKTICQKLLLNTVNI